MIELGTEIDRQKMSLKFYLDTHISKEVAIQLRRRGIDVVVRCEETGMAEASDEEHLKYAAQEDRVMVSKDDDFIRLHILWQTIAAPHISHAGIFFCGERNRPTIGEIVTFCTEMAELVAEDAASIEDDIINQVFYIM